MQCQSRPALHYADSYVDSRGRAHAAGKSGIGAAIAQLRDDGAGRDGLAHTPAGAARRRQLILPEAFCFGRLE
jgi:hypothetical protein